MLQKWRVHLGATLVIGTAYYETEADATKSLRQDSVTILGDKDAAGIFQALEPALTEVVITQNSSPRAMEAEDLAEICLLYTSPSPRD